MKKLLALTLSLMMVFTLAACGEKKTTPSDSVTSNLGSSQQEQTNAPEKIDLSQFTAVDVPDWEILEDWMVPTGGVLTRASEQMGLHFLTVNGITMAEVESYEQVLVDNGLTAHTGNPSTHNFDNENVEVSLALQAVEQTKESSLRITIQKP